MADVTFLPGQVITWPIAITDQGGNPVDPGTVNVWLTDNLGRLVAGAPWSLNVGTDTGDTDVIDRTGIGLYTITLTLGTVDDNTAAGDWTGLAQATGSGVEGQIDATFTVRQVGEVAGDCY